LSSIEAFTVTAQVLELSMAEEYPNSPETLRRLSTINSHPFGDIRLRKDAENRSAMACLPD
jgi:hypothetical protein